MGGLSPWRDYERLSFTAFAFLATFILVAFVAPVLGDGDSWWHLGAGRWIVAHGEIPKVDPFSHSRPGAPWHAHEWLSEVVMWSVFRLGGWETLISLAAGTAGAAAAILCYFLQRWLPRIPAMLMTMVAIICLIPMAWIRPHLLALPLNLIWFIGLVIAREKGGRPPFFLIPLMILWANLHGSFLLGLVMIGPFALEGIAAAEDRRRAFISWSIFGLLAALAGLVTPFGINGYLYPLQVANMQTLHEIQEWKQAALSNSPLFFLLLFAFLATFLLLGVRFSLLRGLLFLFLLFLAFQHLRHQFVFGFLGSILAARPVAEALGPKAEPARSASALDRMVLIVLLMGILGAQAIRVVVPVRLERLYNLPVQTIARLPASVRQGRVFNDYSFGGPLIFFGIKPFIDGRADMYGDRIVKDYVGTERADPALVARLFRQYRIQWTILRPRSKLVEYLDARGWRRIYADDRAVVQVAPGRGAGEPAAGK